MTTFYLQHLCRILYEGSLIFELAPSFEAINQMPHVKGPNGKMANIKY